MLKEIGVRIVDPASRQIGPKHKILTCDLWEPVRGFDSVEFAVDINLFHLVDEDYCRVTVLRDIAGCDLYRQPMVRPITALFQQLASLFPVYRNIGTIA